MRQSVDLAQQALLDTQAYSEVSKRTDDPATAISRAKALRTARELVLSLEDEDAALRRRLEAVFAAGVLDILLSLNVLKHLPDREAEKGISVAKIAHEAGLHEGMLTRLMRLLVATGDILETEPNAYKHGHSVALLEPSRAATHQSVIHHIVLPTLFRLPEYISSHPSADYVSSEHSPMSWAYGMDGEPWINVIKSRPEMLHKFMLSMSGDWNKQSVLEIFDFASYLSAELSKADTKREQDASTQDQRALIVDVGGAYGATLCDIRNTLDAFPLAGPLYLQDLPSVLESIPQHTKSELDRLSIHVQPHDFWTPQPSGPNRGAHIYMLQRILHDWPDDKCVEILRHIAEAMDGNSRCIVADIIAHPDNEPVRVGMGYGYWADIIMMLVGGNERTQAQFAQLFEKAGLELVKVWKGMNQDSLMAVLETRKRNF